MRTFLLLGILVTAAHAQRQPEPVEWTRSPEVLAGKFVSVKLTDGTKIGGTWVSVADGVFTMSVEETSRRKTVSKGIQKLSRDSIANVRARNRRVRGRIIGTLAGLFGGTALILQATKSVDAFPAAFYMSGIVGYFLGRWIDLSSHEIIFVP